MNALFADLQRQHGQPTWQCLLQVLRGVFTGQKRHGQIATTRARGLGRSAQRARGGSDCCMFVRDQCAADGMAKLDVPIQRIA